MTNRLNAGEQLTIDGQLKADNGRTHLVMQGDGNLVLYRDSDGKPLWASGTDHKPVNHAIMQGDGNFVAYDGSNHAFWATGTDHHDGAYVILQDDGNLVVYGPSNTALWASGTNQPGTTDPFSFDSGDVHVGTGMWMHSTASMSSSGLISGRTHTWCTVALRGFHGSAVAVLLDGAGKAIWPSNPQETKHNYGVDGTLVGNPQANLPWAHQVDPAVVAQAKSLSVIHFYDPKNVLLRDIPIIAGTVADIVKKILIVVAAG